MRQKVEFLSFRDNTKIIDFTFHFLKTNFTLLVYLIKLKIGLTIRVRVVFDPSINTNNLDSSPTHLIIVSKNKTQTRLFNKKVDTTRPM